MGQISNNVFEFISGASARRGRARLASAENGLSEIEAEALP
jgi:hypothetical protein